VIDIFTGSTLRMCDRMPRREFLRIGGLGLAGLTLADMLAASARAGGKAGT